MFRKNDPTQTTLTYAGREYLVRKLPPQYQNEGDSPYKRTYWASVCGEILSTTKHDVVRVLKYDLNANHQGEDRKQYRLMLPERTKGYGHVLVASAWCEGKGSLDPDGNVRDQVNHINLDQLNNAAFNLHYVSAKENHHHARVVMPAVALEQRYNAGEQSPLMDYYDEIVAEWLSEDEEVAEYFNKMDAKIVQWLTDVSQPRRDKV